MALVIEEVHEDCAGSLNIGQEELLYRGHDVWGGLLELVERGMGFHSGDPKQRELGLGGTRCAQQSSSGHEAKSETLRS